MVGWLNERLRGERGASLAEFGVAAIFLFLLIFGIVEFGVYMSARESVNTSAREGARFGTALDNLGDCDGIRDAALALEGVAQIDATEVAVQYVTGGSTVDCPIAGSGPGAATLEPGDRIVVTVTADYNALTPIVGPLFPNTITSTDDRSIFEGAMCCG